MVSETINRLNRLSFGLYEVDLQAGELWKAGLRVRLAGQPFRVLVVLLHHAGEIVTREELQAEVWGRNTNVDFERALAGTINKIREALGDSADNPRFIETLTKRGYRFIAPVTTIVPVQRTTQTEVPPEVLPEPPARPLTVEPRSSPFPDAAQVQRAAHPGILPPLVVPQSALAATAGWSRREIWFAATMAVLLALLLTTLWLSHRRPVEPPLHIEQVTHFVPISSGPPNVESFVVLATDGYRILTSVMIDGRPQLSAIDIGTGEVRKLAVPQALVDNSLADISQEGSRLLLRSRTTSESEQPLWVMPSGGGSGLRVGSVLAHDATWMPDGKSILYASGNDLETVATDGGDPVPYARLTGRAFWLRWSPDGRVLRFTLMDPLTHSAELWELPAKDRIPHAVLPGHDLPTACCGTWTADGSAYILEASGNLWKLTGSGRGARLTQLTNGPLRFSSPVAARSSKQIFFLGLEPSSGLQVFSEQRKEFQPAPAFLADASRVEYSRNGAWVAWTDTNGRLWRARAADGSDKVQLTSDSFEVFLAHWSPDGDRLAMMAREPGKLWQTYVISATGGTPEALLQETRNAADPGWSADGQSLVFGREPELMGKESGSHTIQVVNIRTKQVEVLPGSEGLFSPRWSPDGRSIAALTLDQKSVMLYDVASRQWSQLAASSAADPVWSTDSHYLYFHALLADQEPILKVDIRTGKLEKVADLSNFHGDGIVNYFFGGLTTTNSPIVQTRVGTGNIYTLRLDRE